MTIESENKQKINKFFFGEMTEEERFDFEEMFVTDTDFLAEVKAFEDDLIEKYVRNWMTSDEKARFEKNFLNTKKRSEKVEFTKRLIEELDQQNSLQVEEKETFWQKLSALFSNPKFAMASAFSILLLAFGSWYLLKNIEPKQVEIAQNPPAANIEIAKNEIVNLNINGETNIETTNVNSITNLEINSSKPKNIQRPTPSPQRSTNPVLALFAGTLRSDGEIKELNFPPDSSGATFQLNLKSVDYKSFRADLIDGNGTVISQNKNLKPQKSRINLSISKEKLKKGDYRISLYGEKTSGETESVADFQFRVN